QQIGGSRLTNTLDELVTADEGAAGAEYAHEWVPARNLVMLSLATAVAESAGFPYIVLGNNLEEAGAYPDNEMQFINKLNEVLPYATNLHHYVEILMPVGNLMKHEIVRTGLELDAPMDLTWSCYEGGTVHCGTCGPWFMRKKAFEMNGQTDHVFLVVKSMEVPEGQLKRAYRQRKEVPVGSTREVRGKSRGILGRVVRAFTRRNETTRRLRELPSVSGTSQ